MNRNTKYALFGVTFALVAGLMGNNILGVQSPVAVEQDKPSNDGMYLFGHAVVIVKDANGNIKAYRQSDNAVTNTGKTCVAKYLFQNGATRGAAGSGICIGAITAPFTAIAIGNGSSAPTIAAADTRLASEAVGNGISRLAGLVTFTNATGSASAITLIQGTFGPWTPGGAQTTTIQEAGLFNDTTSKSTTGGMFAHILVPSPPVLNAGDSVTIKYTVNIG